MNDLDVVRRGKDILTQELRTISDIKGKITNPDELKSLNERINELNTMIGQDQALEHNLSKGIPLTHSQQQHLEHYRRLIDRVG